MNANEKYNNQSISTVRSARKTYEDLCKERTASSENAFQKKVHAFIEKMCRRMSRKGVYNMSVREAKRIHGPYLSLPTVSGRDNDSELRASENERLQSGYHFYGKFGEFLSIAHEAGLKFDYKWKYNKKKNRYYVCGFTVRFDK